MSGFALHFLSGTCPMINSRNCTSLSAKLGKLSESVFTEHYIWVLCWVLLDCGVLLVALRLDMS